MRLRRSIIGGIVGALAMLAAASSFAGPEEDGRGTAVNGEQPSGGGPTIYVRSRHSPKPPPPAATSEPPAAIPQTNLAPLSPASSAAPVAPPAPPPAANGLPPQALPPAAPSYGQNADPPNLADQVLSHKLGSEQFQKLRQTLEAESAAVVAGDSGKGAPMASWRFDGAVRGTGIDDVAHPSADTDFFHARSAASDPPPVVVHEYKATTAKDAQDIVHTYGSIPGGVVLEGTADIGPVDSLTYDARYNAFIVGSRGVYLMKVPPRSIAVLCRALAQDDKVGVSLGAKEIVYGAVPADSDLAYDLKLADHFLGDIAFARKDWTSGYRFAEGYQPQEFKGEVRIAVFFHFTGFAFDVRDHEFRVTREAFDDRLVPLSSTETANGGLLPDDATIGNGGVPREYEMNVRHIADNIDYYRHERIVDETFAYGEVAAFIRGLKQQGVDLNALARAIDAEFSGT